MSQGDTMDVVARDEADDRRWTLRRAHPMTTSLDGPRLALGESVEVVPASQLEGAVALLDEFDRYASVDDGTAYAGSPFEARVQAFLRFRRGGR